MRFFSKNKRSTDAGLAEWISLAVAAFIVIFIIFFGWKVISATTSQKDDGSIASLDRVYSDMKNLLNSKDSPSYKIDGYYLGKDKMMVAFDTAWDDNEKVSSTNMYRPLNCGGAACICLYDKKNANPSDGSQKDKGIISCRSEAFRGYNIAFASEGGNVEPKTAGRPRKDGNGNYLIFYGDKFGNQRVYIEKSTKDRITYIYMSRIGDAKNEGPVMA